jgi:flagellar basal-body rod modification protein FlgD
MSATPMNATNSTIGATDPTTTSSSSSPNSSLANENVFLQLLVAQLENQDPSNPTDGTQFVTQLAQFSDLSNTTDMASDLDSIKQTLSNLTAAGTTPTSTTNQ